MFPLVLTVPSVLTRNARTLLAVACITWFGVLCFVASLTPNAFVFSDETGYLLPILFGSNADNYQRWSILSAYPSYLYFWIYSFLPSDSLHASAKILNAGFITATVIPAYAVARRYLAIPVAAAFAAVVVLSPINLFVRYVMPEPVYFFGFWLVVLVVVSTLDKSPLLSATAGGTLIGALWLIKPHAIALMLGVGVFYLMRGRLRIHGAIAAATLFLTCYAIRVVLAYFLTGEWVLSVSGSSYAGMLSGYHLDLLATAYNAIGHLSAIVTLVGVPLAVTLVVVVRRCFVQTKETESPTIQRLFDLGLLACCMLATMVAMTIYFSQSVYQISPEEERITRLHGRYYFYVLPLFMLVTIGLWQNGIELSKLLPRWAVVTLCGAMMVAAAVIVFAFETGPVDFPDLTLARRLPFAAMALFVAALILSYYGWGRIGAKNLIIGATIWWAAIGLLTSARMIVIAPFGSALAPKGPVEVAFFGPTDRSGLRRLVGRNDGIIIGSSKFDVSQTMFYLRSLSASRLVPYGTEIRDDDFPKGTRWAVVLPGVRYIGSSQVTQNASLSIVWRQL